MAAFGRESGKVVWRGDAIVRQIGQAQLRAAQRTVVAMKARAQALARVRTGRMRAGVETEVSNVAGGRLRMTLSNRVPYSIYYADEFMKPAFEQEAARFPKRLQAEMQGIR